MPSDNTCIYIDQKISVQEAKRIRAKVPRTDWRMFPFFCVHCGGRVKPHIGSENKPHFEHWPGENNNCPWGSRRCPSGRIGN